MLTILNTSVEHQCTAIDTNNISVLICTDYFVFHILPLPNGSQAYPVQGQLQFIIWLICFPRFNGDTFFSSSNF